MVLLFIYSTVADSFLLSWGDYESQLITYIHDDLIDSCTGNKHFTLNSCEIAGLLNKNLPQLNYTLEYCWWSLETRIYSLVQRKM